MGEVTKEKVRNLSIFLGLGTLQVIVVLEGLARYFQITVPLFPLQFILLGFVAAGLIFIAEF
jgi:phage shock protein PspC (stress-responsive transcriptional regulator)